MHSILSFLHILVQQKNLKDFKNYYEWFMSLVKSVPSLKDSLIVLKTQYLMVQMYYEWDNYKEAKGVIDSIKDLLKAKEQFMTVIECDLYSIAIDLNLNSKSNLDSFSEAYDRVVESAKVHGILMQGNFIAGLEWKIGEIYLKKKGGEKRALDVHLRKAIGEYNRYR